MAESAFIPDAEQFRVWLKDAIARVGVRPSRLAQDAGVAVNSGSKFLSGDQRDLRLETASRLFAQMHLLAVRKGVKLPPFIHSNRLCPAQTDAMDTLCAQPAPTPSDEGSS